MTDAPTPEALEAAQKLLRPVAWPINAESLARALDAFAAAAVERERERVVSIMIAWLPALTAAGQGHSLSAIIDEIRSGEQP